MIRRLVAFCAQRRTLIVFAIVGGINTVIGFSMFPLLHWTIGGRVNDNVLLTVSYMVCGLFSFTSHKRITFASKGKAHSEGVRYVLVTLANWAVNLALFNLILHLAHLDPVVVQLSIAIALQLGNYILYKHFVFHTRASR